MGSGGPGTSRRTALALAAAISWSAAAPPVRIGTHHDPAHLLYAVQSKSYAARPDVVYISSRGACGGGRNCSASSSRRSPGASIAAARLLTEPPFLTVFDSWTTQEYSLEGQDLSASGEVLLVADLLRGHLLSFNATCLRCALLHALELSTNSALT